METSLPTLLLISTLIPVLNPFNGSNPLSVVIMDNASIHHVDEVTDLIEHTAQAKLIFLPPYSPDLMPLEEVFSKVKCVLKQTTKYFRCVQLQEHCWQWHLGW